MLATACDFELELGDPQLPLLIELPDHMADFLLEEGYLEAIYGEQRSNARLRVRCRATRVSDFVPVFVKNRTLQASVLMKDMSRSGIGLLSHEQLWPGETCWIELMQRQLHVQVVRCRKLGPKCFEVGGIITSIVSDNQTADLS